jgi:hypothetical protein
MPGVLQAVDDVGALQSKRGPRAPRLSATQKLELFFFFGFRFSL